MRWQSKLVIEDAGLHQFHHIYQILCHDYSTFIHGCDRLLKFYAPPFAQATNYPDYYICQ